MSGKGSGRRPLSVSQEQFASNWDKAFSKERVLREVVRDAELDIRSLTEINTDGMWKHSCTTMMETFYIGKDEVCDACGAWEEDGQ